MVGRQTFVTFRGAGVGGKKVGPMQVVRANSRTFGQRTYHDHGFHRLQLVNNVVQPPERVEFTTAIAVSVGRHQDLGLGLTKAINHAVRSEVRRGRGKHRTDRGRGQKGDDGFDSVGHPRRYSISRTNPAID